MLRFTWTITNPNEVSSAFNDFSNLLDLLLRWTHSVNCLVTCYLVGPRIMSHVHIRRWCDRSQMMFGILLISLRVNRLSFAWKTNIVIWNINNLRTFIKELTCSGHYIFLVAKWIIEWNWNNISICCTRRSLIMLMLLLEKYSWLGIAVNWW